MLSEASLKEAGRKGGSMLPVCVARQRMLAGLGLMLALWSLLVGCGEGGSATAPEESSAPQTTATTSESREAAKPESPKESSSEASNQPALGERTPTVTPDGVVYCIVGGVLSPDTLRAFYERGELQSPRVS